MSLHLRIIFDIQPVYHIDGIDGPGVGDISVVRLCYVLAPSFLVTFQGTQEMNGSA